jgi:hypothetical protein
MLTHLILDRLASGFLYPGEAWGANKGVRRDTSLDVLGRGEDVSPAAGVDPSECLGLRAGVASPALLEVKEGLYSGINS